MQRALAGLRGVVSMRPREVLPALLAQLLAPPLTLPHARALETVASVAAGALHAQLSAVLPPIVACLSGREAAAEAAALRGKTGASAKAAVALLAERLAAESTPDAVTARLASPLGAALGAVAGHCEGAAGVATAVEALLRYLKDDDDAPGRRVGAWLLQSFVASTPADLGSHIPLLLRELLHRLVDAEPHALRAAWEALAALVSNGAKFPAEELGDHVEFCRSVLSGMVSEARFRKGGVGVSAAYHIPGLCLPKGLDALLPIYQRALMHGSVEQREVAAAGLGELVDVTTHDALKPFYVSGGTCKAGKINGACSSLAK